MSKKRVFGKGQHWEDKRARSLLSTTIPLNAATNTEDLRLHLDTNETDNNDDYHGFEFESVDDYAAVKFDDFIEGCVFFQQHNEMNLITPSFDIDGEIFLNSDISIKEFCLLVEVIKNVGNLNESQQTLLLAFAASILPDSNFIIETLNNTSRTSYYFQKLIKTGCGVLPKCDILEIKVCKSGCTPFIGLNLKLKRCPICRNKNGSIKNSMFYYFPVRQRLQLLLTSDLRPFFDYPTTRRAPSPLFSEDTLDGSVWKHLNSLMGTNERLIGVQICWDGVDRFNFSGKSMWPLAYSILNFPSDLRNKLFLGLFVAALCEGNNIETLYYYIYTLYTFKSHIISIPLTHYTHMNHT